jgi:hypothetical protein
MQKNAIVSSHLMPFIRGNLIRRFRFVSFLLFGLEGERFKGLPNDAIIWNMNVSVRLNSGTTIA